ncbi:MAG: hypothetical protein V4530_03560 [Pseudomonadota bacterium]
MIDKKIEAGKRVAKELFPTEHSIDAAIVGAARFIIAAVEGRKDARLTQGEIHPALVAASESVSTLVQAMGAIASAHDEVVEIRDRHNLPTKGYGCEYSCMPSVAAQQRPDLSIVS